MKKPILVAVIVGVFVTAGLATLVAGGIKRRVQVESKSAGNPRQQLDTQLANERERKLFEMRGTEITPGRDLEHVDQKLLKSLCSLFGQQDPVPQQRMQYFGWADRPELGLRGWYGSIQSVNPSPNGWLVQIIIAPHLVAQDAAVLSTTSKYIENYEVTPQGIRFISGEGAKGPQLLMKD